MAENKRHLLSVGAFCIILVVAILLVAFNVIGWTLIFPFVLALFGIWLIALSAMRSQSAQKYERGSFSTAILGSILIILGGAWYLFSINWLYSLALLILLIAAIAIAAALRRK